MAEIYRARLAAANSKDGPDRVLVIKKVIANLSSNTEFVQMFEEEIKITVGLTHPNIIQIYDYGKVDNQYFMAMEYVEGKNLRQFVKRLADMKSMFSIDMSAYIISQICHALAHAHNYKDRLSGKPLGIVHRDISPQNIMISYDGAVKLFDFGIAKARSASEATRAGVIKGKPSYLSPEQINGEDLDGRCDIFALGIVLWELLTAKRLFVADTDMGVLRLIQSAKIEPPSTFNPAVPQALDAIVLKSLTRDKNKRYQGAEEFQRDLHKFLYSFNPSFNPADLSYYAQELFKVEIRDDRDRLAKFLAIEPIDNGGERGEGVEPNTKKSLSTKLADGLVSASDFNREMMDNVVATGTSSLSQPSDLQLSSSINMAQPKNGKPALPGGSSASNSLKNNVTPLTKRTADNMVIPPWSKQGVPGGQGRTTMRTASALRRAVDDESSSSGRNVGVLLVLLMVGSVVAARQYCMLKGTPLDFLNPDTCSRPIALAPSNAEGGRSISSNPAQPAATQTAPVSQDRGVIILQTTVSDYQVFVNGRQVGVMNNQFEAPLNEDLKIDVVRFGFQSAHFQTKLVSPSPAAFRVDLVPLPSGTMYFATTPVVKASFYQAGKLIFEGNTPIRDQLMPAGHYRVVMENSLLSLHSEAEIEVEEGKLLRVEKVLK
jgi:serine/threonine-protein kinase